MIRKKKDITNRRARLDIAGGEATEELISDPVAAALAERQTKKGADTNLCCGCKTKKTPAKPAQSR